MKIFDACGDADLAERQLAALVPEMMDDSNEELECLTSDSNRIIGLVDFIGLTDDSAIGEQLVSLNIPFLSVGLDDFLPSEEIAEVG